MRSWQRSSTPNLPIERKLRTIFLEGLCEATLWAMRPLIHTTYHRLNPISIYLPNNGPDAGTLSGTLISTPSRLFVDKLNNWPRRSPRLFAGKRITSIRQI